MKILDILNQITQQKDVKFILIGGHAINIYGDRRHTTDIDLLVCENQKDKIIEIISGLNYKIFNESEAFLQFNPEDIGQWPLDCLLVNEQTFNEIFNDAKKINIGGDEDVLVPSIRHLITMKLHSLKHSKSGRRLKDLLDIITLINCAEIDINAEEFKQLCLKYATEKDYDEIVKNYE